MRFRYLLTVLLAVGTLAAQAPRPRRSPPTSAESGR